MGLNVKECILAFKLMFYYSKENSEQKLKKQDTEKNQHRLKFQ